jgi:hypothetical protein
MPLFRALFSLLSPLFSFKAAHCVRSAGVPPDGRQGAALPKKRLDPPSAAFHNLRIYGKVVPGVEGAVWPVMCRTKPLPAW